MFYPTSSPRADILDPDNMDHMPGIGGMHTQQTQRDPQGIIPALFDLLWEAYAKSLKKKLDERRANKEKSITLDEALKRAPASHFVDFCSEYLAKHRPVQQFSADANLGFMLSNNKRALLCPPISGGYYGEGGQMQDAQAIGVTRGRSQPGMDGVVNDGGIPII